jgi:chromosome segregation ATPase
MIMSDVSALEAEVRELRRSNDVLREQLRSAMTELSAMSEACSRLRARNESLGRQLQQVAD